MIEKHDWDNQDHLAFCLSQIKFFGCSLSFEKGCMFLSKSAQNRGMKIARRGEK
jgi:hypothetical protein